MPRTRRIHLQRRDLAILEALASRRAETLEHLHDHHFAGLSRKRAVNRLGDLAAHGYLVRVEVADAQGAMRNAYVLGPKAPTALRIRSLAGEHLGDRRRSLTLAARSIPHQLAVNRVGDALGAALIPEHLVEGVRGDRRHRPDAAYRCAPDERGRDVVFVEVDLGHYSRARILGKVRTFFEHPEARSIIFATTTAERAELVGAWIRRAHGDAVMQRIQLLSIAELQAGAALDAGTEPTDPVADRRAAA